MKYKLFGMNLFFDVLLVLIILLQISNSSIYSYYSDTRPLKWVRSWNKVLNKVYKALQMSMIALQMYLLSISNGRRTLQLVAKWEGLLPVPFVYRPSTLPCVLFRRVSWSPGIEFWRAQWAAARGEVKMSHSVSSALLSL